MKITKVVDIILGLTKTDDYMINLEKQSLVRSYEDQIDSLTYELYGLNHEEIKMIDESFHLDSWLYLSQIYQVET